jgi:hypothetical protein
MQLPLAREPQVQQLLQQRQVQALLSVLVQTRLLCSKQQQQHVLAVLAAQKWEKGVDEREALAASMHCWALTLQRRRCRRWQSRFE